MEWFCTQRSSVRHCDTVFLPRDKLQIIVLSHYKCYVGQKQANYEEMRDICFGRAIAYYISC